MTKRATLSLSSEYGPAKKQFSRLKPDTATNKPKARAAHSRPTRSAPAPDSRAAAKTLVPKSLGNHSHSKLIVNTLFVIGIAALSLYFLRRGVS